MNVRVYINTSWNRPVKFIPIKRKYLREAETVLRITACDKVVVIRCNHRAKLHPPEIEVNPKDITILMLGGLPKNLMQRLRTDLGYYPNY